MFRGPISKLARAGRSAKRNVRSLHVEAHTLEHPTPEAVSALIPSDLADSKGTVLFSLSTSTPGSDIPALVSTVGKNSVGSFHISGIPTLSLAILRPEEGETLSTFYDSTVGRAPVQVGKWQRLGTSWTDDKRGAGVGELANVLGTGGWEEVWRGEEAAAGVDVPERTQAVICLTDGTPQPLLSALDKFDAVKLGLVSAPTPFLTGRPHTLLHNGTAYSTGSVGVALSTPPRTDVEYGIEPLDKAYTVSSARGNLLLSLDGAPNPTQALIAALQRRDSGRPRGEGLSKDEDFWLSIKDADGVAAPRIVRILSGDPSRGTMSVAVEATLAPGQIVQFMHRPTTPQPLRPLSASLRFGTAPRADEFAEPASRGETRLKPGFLAASEDGFIFGAKGQPGTVVTVPGAVVTARWWS